MSSQRLSPSRIALFGGLVVIAIGFAFAAGRTGNAGQPRYSPPPHPIHPPNRPHRRPRKLPVPAVPEDRPADRTAVEKALDGFTGAFKQGDGKAVAALWTAEGEYISDDGTTYRGRAALEKRTESSSPRIPTTRWRSRSIRSGFPPGITPSSKGTSNFTRGRRRN